MEWETSRRCQLARRQDTVDPDNKEDMLWYQDYLRTENENATWRKEYIRWWEEHHPDSMIKYYAYCMKYRIWRHESNWHPDSPWYGEDNDS